MTKHQPVFIYLLIFLALTILLKIIGVIDTSVSEILGYLFIFYGISLVYLSFGKKRKLALFFGSVLFLTGIVLYLINNFDFYNPAVLVYPSFFFISGISLFLLFIDDHSSKLNLILSIILFIMGFIYVSVAGSFSLPNFFYSLINITLNYWPILLIVGGIIFLLNRERL